MNAWSSASCSLSGRPHHPVACTMFVASSSAAASGAVLVTGDGPPFPWGCDPRLARRVAGVAPPRGPASPGQAVDSARHVHWHLCRCIPKSPNRRITQMSLSPVRSSFYWYTKFLVHEVTFALPSVNSPKTKSSETTLACFYWPILR